MCTEKAKVVAAVWGTEFIQFLAALCIYTEEKTKVAAAVWGTKFIQFLAALATVFIQKRRQRSSPLLFGGQNVFNSLPR